MAQKKITDLQLASLFAVGLSMPADDGIQTYRVTGQQMQDFFSSFVNKNSGLLKNVGLSVTAAAGAMTVALKQADGSTNPTTGILATQIAVRSRTLTSGAQTILDFTGALSLVLPSTATLGFANGANARVFVYAYYDGTNQGIALSAMKIDENQLFDLLEIGTGSDSDSAIYADAARTAAALRLIGGFQVSAITTAGTWTTPTWVSVLTKDDARPVKTVATTYTATAVDKVLLASTSGGAWTLSLPAAADSWGKTLTVKKTSSDTNALTIDANSSETIDGATTMILFQKDEFVTLFCDGAGWVIVGRYFPKTPTAFTPTGAFSTNTTYTGFWWRDGKELVMKVKAAFAGLPNTTNQSVNIPFSLNIDTSGLLDTTSARTAFTAVGTLWDNSASLPYNLGAVYNDATSVLIRRYAVAGTPGETTFGLLAQNNPVTIANADFMEMTIRVPISGW